MINNSNLNLKENFVADKKVFTFKKKIFLQMKNFI